MVGPPLFTVLEPNEREEEEEISEQELLNYLESWVNLDFTGTDDTAFVAY